VSAPRKYQFLIPSSHLGCDSFLSQFQGEQSLPDFLLYAVLDLWVVMFESSNVWQGKLIRPSQQKRKHEWHSYGRRQLFVLK
jgi:hypothetical protein